MAEKTISLEKKLTKFNVPPSPEECSEKEEAKVRRTVKLPRLKLEDLVVQVTAENAHKEIPNGPAVGSELKHLRSF